MINENYPPEAVKGLDHALERLGVLIRKGGNWGSGYQNRLGLAMRMSLSRDPVHIQARFAEILQEYGCQPAIDGFAGKEYVKEG